MGTVDAPKILNIPIGIDASGTRAGDPLDGRD